MQTNAWVSSSISRIKVEWYDTIFLLVGSVVAVVDPVTDILTLREFYLEDHKIWFSVGLGFVVLPSLLMSFIHWWQRLGERKRMMDLILDVIFGWNPLSLFFMRFKAFILCSRNFEKLRHKTLEDDCRKQIQQLMFVANLSGQVEASLESAPQFIIQLHATVVQQEQVSTIQIISLCASFLSITWTFANTDVRNLMSLEGRSEIGSPTWHCKIITTVFFYVSRIFHLSSRLLAITFFTVGFKWWAIAVFVFHSIALAFHRVCIDFISGSVCQEGCNRVAIGTLLGSFVTTFIDHSPKPQCFEENKKRLMIIGTVPLSFLFVIENVIMIGVFYSKEEPHAWYSVPITVCVCVFSLVGSLMKVGLYRFILRERDLPDSYHNF